MGAKSQIIVLHNRSAGKRRATVAHLCQALARRSIEVTQCDALDELGHQLERWSPRAIICAGGDGTANAALNIVGDRVPMVPYPLGNENLLAKHLGIGSDVDRMADLVCRGQACHYDVAAYGQRRFLIMLSCGFDAEVVERVHRDRTGHISKRDYFREALGALRRYRFAKMQIDLLDQHGVSRQHEGHWVFVFNIASYARGLPVAAEADPQDGLLDVCIFRGRSLLQNLGHAATVLVGVHGAWSGCHKVRATRVRITSEKAVPFQVDGDPGGQTPIDVHIVPRGVQLLVPCPTT